jgi:hypothetical protein
VVAQEAEHIDANDLAAIWFRRIEHVDNAGGIEGDEKGFQVDNEVLCQCRLVLVLTPWSNMHNVSREAMMGDDGI